MWLPLLLLPFRKPNTEGHSTTPGPIILSTLSPLKRKTLKWETLPSRFSYAEDSAECPGTYSASKGQIRAELGNLKLFWWVLFMISDSMIPRNWSCISRCGKRKAVTPVHPSAVLDMTQQSWLHPLQSSGNEEEKHSPIKVTQIWGLERVRAYSRSHSQRALNKPSKAYSIPVQYIWLI